MENGKVWCEVLPFLFLKTKTIVRPALRQDGQPFSIRVSLSVMNLETDPIFSALIEPVYECEIRTNEFGVILSSTGAPWLFFGQQTFIGKHISAILCNESDWRADICSKVVMCKNVDGDQFAVTLKVRMEVSQLIGSFSDTPPLKVKMMIDESGVISACSGETVALLGYKESVLKGKLFEKLFDKDCLSGVVLDCKSVVSVKHCDGRTVFCSLRVTRVKQLDSSTMFKAILKGSRPEKLRGLFKGGQLRFGGPVLGWYEVGPCIGYGLCGPVKRAVHRLTGQDVAIKTLVRDRYKELNMAFPPEKIVLLEHVRHPNLVQMFDTICTVDVIFIIMELIDGGEFFEYCAKVGALPEDQSRGFWKQLVSAVNFLHYNHICHRDIKLENIMLDATNNVKIVDFGFACSFRDDEMLQLFCGSPDYAAPELVRAERYRGPQVDTWALGVVLYIMLTGFIPFTSPARIEALKWAWPPDIICPTGVIKVFDSIFRPACSRGSLKDESIQNWANSGTTLNSLSWKVEVDGFDVDIIIEMERKYGWSKEDIETALRSPQSSNQICTTYYLLEHKKVRSLHPKNIIWKPSKRNNSSCQIM